MKTIPDRFTLLDEAHQDCLEAYGVYYQESQVKQAFPLHGHSFYEMELVVGGSGKQWINGHPVRLETGSLYLLSPTDMHRMSADTTLSFYSVKLPADRLPGALEKLLRTDGVPIAAQLRGEAYAACRSDFQRLKSALSKPSPYGEANSTALVTLLLTALLKTAPPGQTFASSMAFHRQHIVLEYIHAHYLSPVTLREIADAAGLSPNYLSAQFVRVVGCGFIDYLTQLRLQHACTLLAETDMSVTEIAYDSGFGSLSHFIRTFRRQKHVTPSAYRRG